MPHLKAVAVSHLAHIAMRGVLLSLLLALVAACTPAAQTPEIIVSLMVDGRERSFTYDAPITVAEFLRDADVTLGEIDDVNPPTYSQIADGMRVTVVRVREENECENIDVPYRRQTVPYEGMQPGEERIGQAGQNGVTQICYRVEIRDGVRADRQEVSRTVVSAPVDEVVFVGPAGSLDPVSIPGTLAYINNNNVWVMSGSSTTRRFLTNTGDVDGRVFSLTPDGQRLIFSRATPSETGGFSNRLYLITDTDSEAEPIELPLTNVLYAEWVPGRENTIAYSTAEPRSTPPGWQAYNDLWLVRIDPASGELINPQRVVENNSGGFAGWWGTGFAWSEDGTRLAYARANGIGLINLDTGEFESLVTYTPFNSPQSWSWRANISWSADDQFLLTTVHGSPIGSEPPETSPAFHIAVAEASGAFSVDLANNAGIWSTPEYAPPTTDADGATINEQIAYLRARSINNSISESAEYDLVVADRDGSNAQVVFPASSAQPGLRAREFAWAPDGRSISFVYQGSLWLVDVESGIANQLTLDSGAARPVWTR
ncbi:MAG: G5 domain-containing protein [Anaerolineae bacterium]|nr:G5 domain-containing protein [Anaerolineae bacterium]